MAKLNNISSTLTSLEEQPLWVRIRKDLEKGNICKLNLHLQFDNLKIYEKLFTVSVGEELLTFIFGNKLWKRKIFTVLVWYLIPKDRLIIVTFFATRGIAKEN